MRPPSHAARIPFALAFLVASAAHPAVAAVEPATVLSGMCDASAGVALDGGLVAVANDEDNVLRFYDVKKGGHPVRHLDLTAFVRLEEKHPEVDLEGAAQLGDRVYWIGSHGRNKDGKPRPNRHRFFATKIERAEGGARLVPVGAPYSKLLSDLLADARLKRFGLLRGSVLAPKAPGGLNIEALCGTADGAA